MATVDNLGQMGNLNKGWGICGFTSSLYALYSNTAQQQQGTLSGSAQVSTRMLAEIKTYLRMLQADNETGLLDDIEGFTRSFKNFGHFDIGRYIETINNSVSLPNGPDVKDVATYSIAMPPHAVVDYLKRGCGFNNARMLDGSSSASEMILGVTSVKNPQANKYNNLAHYLYQNKQLIYSWGQQFASVTQAMGGGSTVVYRIAIT